MPTYTGKCDCGQTTWEVELDKDTASHILCHCNTCKRLSGGAFTLNQIIPKDSLKFTKGGDELKKYTYSGESGRSLPLSSSLPALSPCPPPPPHPASSPLPPLHLPPNSDH